MSGKQNELDELKQFVHDHFEMEKEKVDDNFSAIVKAGGREVIFKSCLLSGIAEDGNETPMAMFVGRFHLGEFGVVLMSQLRAVYKLLLREFDMNKLQAEDFVIFCLANAIKVEEEAQERIKNGDPFEGETVTKMTKDNS